jgi:phenylacetate-CoA ligase
LELKEIQTKRLKEILSLVYKKNSFYKQKLDEYNIDIETLSSIEDIKRLPFTTKKDIQNSYPISFFSADKKDIVRYHTSSGTTSKPIIVGYTKKDIDTWTTLMKRVFDICGVDSSDTIHNAYNYGLFTGGLGFHQAVEAIGASIIPASSGFSQRHLTLLNELQATVLCATPSFALHLANIAKGENREYKKDFSIKKGIFGAEPTTKELKDKIIEAWDLEYYEIYGLSEIQGPGVACSCKYSENLHIFEDYFYPEIINPNTNEILDYGESGELVLTTLNKEGMPLIRYKTGDITSLKREKCKCGLEYVQMTPINKRVDNMIIVNGLNIYPSQVETILKKSSYCTNNYQLIIEKCGALDKVTIHIELNSVIDDVSSVDFITKDIEHLLLSYLYMKVKVTLYPLNTFTFSQNKTKKIIDNRQLSQF